MTRRSPAASLLAAAALLAAGATTFLLLPRERRGGAAIHEARAPARVASLNLAADEVLAEILPPDRLVGVTRFVDEEGTSNVVGRVPAEVFRFPKADMEALLARRPDLVVVSEFTDADFRSLLERSGMRVHRMSGLNDLAGIRQAILDLGAVVRRREEAARLVDRFDIRRAALRERLQGTPRPRVLYWSGGMTAGGKTTIGALIVEAGGRNAGEEMGIDGILPVGGERAYASDPDVILVGSWGEGASEVRNHPLMKHLRAVKQDRIVVLPNELLITVSHFAAVAAWRLGALLHPGVITGDAP